MSSDVRPTLIHELTHAFDHARPGTFATDLHRTACTEVRASSLGQCREITNPEVRRDCVFRDAVGSVWRHVGGDEGVARRVVGEVMKGCAGDGEPMGMFREAMRKVRDEGGGVR
ncbi:Mitochondrial inner membrane protease atp23 [Saitoella coloradoensis]